MAWACERSGAGALVDLVTVQKLKADAEKNSFGEVLQDDPNQWEAHCQEWAEVQLVGGDEANQPSQQVAIRRWAIRVRLNPSTSAITSLMRAVLPGGEVLNITRAGDPTRERRWIELELRESP
jgi:head-tail adaptor